MVDIPVKGNLKKGDKSRRVRANPCERRGAQIAEVDDVWND